MSPSEHYNSILQIINISAKGFEYYSNSIELTKVNGVFKNYASDSDITLTCNV